MHLRRCLIYVRMLLCHQTVSLVRKRVGVAERNGEQRVYSVSVTALLPREAMKIW